MKVSDLGAASGPDVLWHPLVLKGAWTRVEDWYRSGNLAPEPELSRWRLHPEAELRKLGSALREDTWRPSRWPQVPYPKKGACLRHYVVPTVRDQVAFMAYLVLLGPLLDSRVANFVFGNRWNRRIAWDRRRSRPQWVLRPYQLLSGTAYLPYARSHGLFRRVAHWTVARMTGAEIEEEDYGGYVQHPDDYAASEALPEWTRKEWWPPPDTEQTRVYWATLDIELAFPSIRLSRLRTAIAAMLRNPPSVLELTERYGGYPRQITEAVADPQGCQSLAMRLMDALESVRVDAAPIPEDAWRPTHAIGDLPPEEKDPGLPTGLAISGILLNVALHGADRSLRRYLDDHRHGAIVRFADEFIILARSPHALFGLMETAWQGLAEDANSRLARAETESNLYLNWSKIEPCSVRDIVRCFLIDQGWKECEQSERCHHLNPPPVWEETASFREWWNARDCRDNATFTRMADALARSAVGPGEVGPFVTTLVARMSAIGRDTLAERFGQGARERLIRLHDLARFDIDDLQVRSDTRRTFAANRLVRAWLPEESSRRDLADIRDSVAHVLSNTPWKFSLWHAVVRAAARRPQRSTLEDDHVANDWLASQLGLVASAPHKRHVEAWMNTWPEDEDDDNEDHGRGSAWRGLYLSFHRAAFWHALAAALRSLWQHDDEATHPVAGYAGPSPDRWTVRAVPDGSHGHVRTRLGALDRWVDVLYPPDPTPDLSARGWELDQLAAAVLASASRHDLAVAWRHAEPPGDELKVPAGPLWDGIPRTMLLLERLGRVSRHSGEHDLTLPTLAHVWLGGQDRRLGELLFPRDRPSRIAEARDDPRSAAAAAISLGCSESISAVLASTLVQKPEHAAGAFGDDGLALWEHHRARRILLGQPEGLR